MKTIRNFILLTTACLLTACGGSSSSSDDATAANLPAVGGIVRSGVAFGPIDGFGSVIVNGVRYSTTSASFTIDDAVGIQSDLKIGQIVTLKTKTDDSGKTEATEVIFDDDVEGPITSIDLANNTLVVLGQTVLVDSATVFDNNIMPASLDGLTIGDIVEVSGLYNADNALIASFIEIESTQSEFEVHGIVTNLDTTAMTFMINDLSVDYSQAILKDFDSAMLSDGNYVEVKGSTLTNNVLVATEVELEENDDKISDSDDEAEIEGFITQFTSAQSFSVAGVPVISTADTVYEDGASSDLALNVRVEVEGLFNENGQLVADEIQFKLDADIEISSSLDSIDITNNTITIYGVTVTLDENTSLEDSSDVNLSPFTINDLVMNDYIEVKAFLRNGNLFATRIKRDDPEDIDEIKAFVESVSADSLVLLDVEITTDTNTEYQDTGDTVLSSTEFFNRVAIGDLIEVEGSKTSTTSMLAEKMEFDD